MQKKLSALLFFLEIASFNSGFHRISSQSVGQCIMVIDDIELKGEEFCCKLGSLLPAKNCVSNGCVRSFGFCSPALKQ